MVQSPQNIKIAGAGILGLWQAYTLAKSGHNVRVYEASEQAFVNSASQYAGTMLGPDCEGEAAPRVVQDLGYEGIAAWRDVYPGVVNAGSLVLANPRDLPELTRFSAQTTGFAKISADQLEDLEPSLAGRYSTALYYENEAHVETPDAMQYLLNAAEAAGAEFHFGQTVSDQDLQSADCDIAIDCRGIGARNALSALRGVRGERLIIKTRDVQLSRPIRLLHPRFPLYIVPWPNGRFMVGATVIESEDAGSMTVRSALELLGMAYALNPAFGEAEILHFGSGVRPAFPDNVPRFNVDGSGRVISVNGAFRHGFLLAPVLAKGVANFLLTGATDHPLFGKISAEIA